MCNFCGKVTKGGITRAKEHLMAKPGNVAACANCPIEVTEELWGYFKDKKKQECETFKGMCQHFLEDYGDSDEERALDEGFANIASRKSTAGKKNTSKGLIDLFFRNPESAIEKKKEKEKREIKIRKHKAVM